MKFVCRSIAIYLTFFTLILHVSAVEAVKQGGQPEISLAGVRDKIDIIKNKSNLEEAQRIRILNAYYATEDNLEELQSLEQQIQSIQVQLKRLPAEIKQLEKKISVAENQLKTQKQEQFALYPNDELEQRLIIEKSSLNDLKAAISRLEIQLAEQLKRPQQIREKVAEIKNIQTNTLQEQAALAALIQNKQELDARQAQLDSRSSRLNAKLTTLDLENIAYPLSMQAQKLELQWLNLQSEQLSRRVKGIDDFLTERRQLEIDKAQAELIQAQKESAGKHPLIQNATRENVRYNRLLQETNKKLEHYLNQKSQIEKRYKQLEKDYQSAEKKINLAGLSPALGNLLREQRRNLPLLKDYQPMFETLQQEIALAGLELFQLEEVQRTLANIDESMASQMAAAKPLITDELEKLKVRTELRILLNLQKDQALKLNSVYSEYSRTLADVDFALQQLVKLGEKYSQYLNERLLWVPSAPVFNKHYLLEIGKSLLWFGDISHWQQLAVDIKNSIKINPLLAFFGVSIFALELWYRQKIKIELQELLKKCSKLYSDRFVYTFYCLGYVFLLVLPLALLVAWLGWITIMNIQAAAFSRSVATGLLAAAIPMLLIQFFYHLFKPAGVVQTLFNWQKHGTHLIYRQLRWLRLVVVPAVFIIGMFIDDAYSERSYSLGRMALIVAMMALSYLFHRFAHPAQGVAKDFYLVYSSSWLCRLRYVWYGIFVLIPWVIIGFAIAGYYQSALELQYKLIVFIRLIFFSVLLHEIIMRGMVLANRQLALENARKKRKLLEQSEGKDKKSVDTKILEEEPLLDIPKINEQNRKLLGATIIAILLVGSWLNFRDILPALSIFDQVVLWQHMALVNGQETPQSITLINVFVVLLYLVLMLVFVKNFPGLIDVLFVGRYSMTAGGRYALVQLTRYTVIAMTFIAAANKLGGSWSQVQWLVAALSVGLGFGLQEIFANMVSGIILLFERPIRVGDTVTVGDVSGKVSRIAMRATTITDWDQKELVVPNKMFITERLVNWTLTDTVTRVVIPVGVSYSSDDQLVQQLLEQVVSETPLVLKEPVPTVLFVGFGDSSLNFSVRVFVRDLGERLPATADIHKRIRLAFKEHNIEIPFPQRDLHIRSSVLSDEPI